MNLQLYAQMKRQLEKKYPELFLKLTYILIQSHAESTIVHADSSSLGSHLYEL